MVPLTVAISLLTLGVEEIGVIIEEPFSVLPLEVICASVATDVKELRVGGAMGLTGEGGEKDRAGALERGMRMVPAAQLVRKRAVPLDRLF